MIIINNLLKKPVLISEFQNNVDQENFFVNIFWCTSSFIKLLHKKFNNEKIIIVTVIFFFLFFFYNSFVIKDREYMYIAAKANTRHDPIYKIK